jgi:hypothetical protein
LQILLNTVHHSMFQVVNPFACWVV